MFFVGKTVYIHTSLSLSLLVPENSLYARPDVSQNITRVLLDFLYIGLTIHFL